ncbi:M24 family metallopeptidase [Pseudooceanicola nanhaiensis]|uniref:M24 family metallopeptidase n=1 Tax=Pseudooceanicola nanhaiensis TaxID=375761 RepID=UPI001CD6D8B9|nr:Xaa-Pro peptidase family protein [Pseudooceanicola nanhaiensis]MCA0918733.1 Xaa-Pro peptidase family protein [Pseudooceanicola nanhaiensis]
MSTETLVVPASKRLLFPASDFQARAAAVQAGLRQQGVDLAIYDEIEAVQWLTGFPGAMNIYRCLLLPATGAPIFLIRALDCAPFTDVSWIDDVVTFNDWDSPAEVIAQTIRGRGMDHGTIGIDKASYGMPVGFLETLQGLLPGTAFADVGAIVTDRRMIKSPAELDLLRRSADLTDTAMIAAIAAAKEGAVLRDVVKAAYRAYLDGGADPAPVGPITVGKGVDFLHGHLRPEPLKAGEICHIELLPKIAGYSSRMMRPVAIGGATERQQRVADRLIALQDAQFAAMKPGAMARDVDAVVRDALVAEGLREDFTGISGYTVGFNGPATPRTSDFNRVFHPKADWVLAPGMTFHMYLVADGIAFSETILATQTGHERLTKLDRRLFESQEVAA